MKYKLVLQQEAVDDMSEAFSWYEERKTGLGFSFISQIENYFEKLLENPEYGGMLNKWMRRMKVQGFPYIIIYEIDNSHIFITSVFHTSRFPKH